MELVSNDHIRSPLGGGFKSPHPRFTRQETYSDQHSPSLVAADFVDLGDHRDRYRLRST